jgi:RNA polymerase sigma-70 factor (ECF subfamily)
LESDRDLVESSLRGDTSAFAALVDRYRYAVFGLCLGHTQDVDAAEDITQEVLIKAFLKLRDLRDLDRFAPWLRRIAANACRTWRRRPIGHTSLGELGMKELSTQADSPEDELVSREVRQTVLTALGELSAPQQQVITLFYLEELSLEQIAAFLNISPQAANQRLYRARLRLKEVMLGLVEKTFKEQKLPDDFTDQVLSAALARGRQLLEARRWPEARAEFHRIAEIAAQHREALRGVAQALAGEVKEMFGAERAYDDEVVQAAFAALEEAYRLGARDPETVWGLVSLYQSADRYVDLVRVAETYMVETDDVEQMRKALGQAAYHAYLILKDYERVFRLHRRFLSIGRIGLDMRLGSYCLPISAAYLEVGHAETWLKETEVLAHELGPPLTRSHCNYYADKIDLLNRRGDYKSALQNGRRFLDRLEHDAIDKPTHRRWWMVDIYGPMLQSYQKLGDEDGLHGARREGWEVLRAYETEWQTALATGKEEAHRKEADQDYRYAVSVAYHNFGYYCRQVGLVKEAIELFGRSLEFRPRSLGYLFLAGLKMQKGDREGSIEALKFINEQWRSCILTGYARKHFCWDAGFETVRRDETFLSLIGGEKDSGEKGRADKVIELRG